MFLLFSDPCFQSAWRLEEKFIQQLHFKMNIFNKIICLFLHLLWYKSFSCTYIFTTLKSLQNTLVSAQFLRLGQLSNWVGGCPHNSGDEEVCPVSNLGKFEVSVGLCLFYTINVTWSWKTSLYFITSSIKNVQFVV